MCAEAGDFFCASSGFSQANLIFRRLVKDYEAAGKPAAQIKEVKDKAEIAANGVRKIDEYERRSDF
jgi:hypothetical protein